jgi:hypothetical protein
MLISIISQNPFENCPHRLNNLVYRHFAAALNSFRRRVRLSKEIHTMKLVVSFVCIVSAVLGTPTFADVVVSPDNMNGWTIYTTNNTGALNTGSGTGNFVSGPATPPLGLGSGHLMTPSGGGDQSVQFRNIGFAGTRIADLTSLSYSTYASAWNGQQLPYLTIWLDTGDRLHFEPTYSAAGAGNGNPNPQADPALNTWQTWDALDGMWYSDNFAGPGSNAVTLAGYLTLAGTPNAAIADAVPGVIGGFRLTSGFASDTDNFNTNIDNVTIGTASGSTTFDFEPAAVPEPTAFLFGGLVFGAVGVAAGYRRFVGSKKARKKQRE